MISLHQYLSHSDHRLEGKKVLLREDFNVKIVEGKIISDLRLRAALPSILELHKRGAIVLILSHMGRPVEGVVESRYSLSQIVPHLSHLLNLPVRFVPDWINGVSAQPGEIIVLENVRFLRGENENDPVLAEKMAKLADVVVMDAFAVSHRIQASTVGVIQAAKIALAGPLLMSEVQALNQALEKPKHPLVSIIGGAKIADKVSVIQHLLKMSDTLILGGGVANTFLAAQGHQIGQSLYEADQIDLAKQLLKQAKEKKWRIVLPSDVVVARKATFQSIPSIKELKDIEPEDKILDVGPHTTTRYSGILADAKTIIWSGPLGAFEYPPFAEGTRLLVKMIAKSEAYSLVGGGETLAAVEKAGLVDEISYLSTGGGAFLAYCEGRGLPALEALERSNSTED